VAGLVVASFSLAQIVCSPLTGRLSDRVGRNPVFISGPRVNPTSDETAGRPARTAAGSVEFMSDVVSRHRTACDEFSSRVAEIGDKWDAPTPCTEWAVRDLVEHVVANHERLVSALGDPVARDPDDLAATWRTMEAAAFEALATDGVLDVVVPGPFGEAPVGRFLNIITTDTLVHAWDLARALGVDETLDADLCQRAYERARPGDELLRASGMFGPRIDVPDDARVEHRLVAFFGREPM